jgi:hypothetical protein
MKVRSRPNKSTLGDFRFDKVFGKTKQCTTINTLFRKFQLKCED